FSNTTSGLLPMRSSSNTVEVTSSRVPTGSRMRRISPGRSRSTCATKPRRLCLSKSAMISLDHPRRVGKGALPGLSAWKNFRTRRAHAAMSARVGTAGLASCTTHAHEPPLPTLLLLHRILHRLEGLELDVVQLAVHLLDLAEVDVLHDVAGVGIDRDDSARALPFHALHGGDELVALGLAVGLLQRLVDEMHAVIAAERDEVGAEVVRLLERLDISLVHRRVVQRGVLMRRDDADHLVAQAVELVVVGEVARADDADAGLVEPALDELLGEDAGLGAGEVDEGGVRPDVSDAL